MTDKLDYCKLIMVTVDNNNKYYEMQETSDGMIELTSGRVEVTAIKQKPKPMTHWAKIKKAKEKKGYKDVTAFVATEITTNSLDKLPVKDDIKLIKDSLARDFVKIMNTATNNLVSSTYSVKADNVTRAQVDHAQSVIDKLNQINHKTKKNHTKINELLLDLYTTIPRRMSNTRVMIMPHIDFSETMEEEQDNLDAMESQVVRLSKKKVVSKTTIKSNKKVEKDFLEKLGVTLTEGKVTKDLEYLVNQFTKRGRRHSSAKIHAILDVVKPSEDTDFDKWQKKQKNKDTRHLIHGTHRTSVIPIMQQGLKIRPKGNFQFSGKAYGDGNYFSEVVDKSLGYTDYHGDQVLLVYEVHVGNPFVYQGWYNGNSFKLCYKELEERGFDSTHVKAGNGLLNSEIIVYKEQQCRLKHILWIK